MKKYTKSITFVFLILCFFCKSQTGNWMQQVSGTIDNLHTLFFVNNDTGFVANSTDLFATVNGGTNWINVNSNPHCNDHYLNGWYNNRIYFVNDSTGYTSEGETGVFKTNNYGATWNPVITDNTMLWYCLFLRDSNIYVPALNQTLDSIFIFKSPDLGMSWSKTYTYTFDMLNCTGDIGITSLNDSIGFLTMVINGQGILYKTNTDFVSFYDSDTLTDGSVLALHHSSFYNDSCGFFTGGSGEIVATCNQGDTWQSISIPVGSNLQCDLIRLASGTIYVCGGAFNIGYIISSIDGGLSWQIEYQSNEPVSQMFFVNSSVGFAVGDNGRILKYNKIVGLHECTAQKNDFLIYPTICSNSLFVNSLQNDFENDVTKYAVLDEIGKLELEGEGKGALKINTQNLRDGIYFLRLVSKNSTEIKKFIVQQ